MPTTVPRVDAYEAKTEATRARRRTQAIEWIAAGKSRNWKYEKC